MAEQLTEKYHQLQVELKDCRKELEQLQAQHTGVLAEMDALRSLLSIPQTYIHIHFRAFTKNISMLTQNKVNIFFQRQ